jgi:hypothetical protein
LTSGILGPVLWHCKCHSIEKRKLANSETHRYGVEEPGGKAKHFLFMGLFTDQLTAISDDSLQQQNLPLCCQHTVYSVCHQSSLQSALRTESCRIPQNILHYGRVWKIRPNIRKMRYGHWTAMPPFIICLGSHRICRKL